MSISGLVKTSLVDYPGLVSCVLFVSGCNYNCFYCHNRSLICKGKELFTIKYVEDFLKKRIGLLDGVVITGGEPTLDPNLIAYIKMIKKLGFKVKLDTNGSSPKMIQQLVDAHMCDYFAVDYKAPSNSYKNICGDSADSKSVLETIHILQNNHIDFEVRTTVIPQFREEDLICMAKELSVVPRYSLNRYRKPKEYQKSDEQKVNEIPYTQKEIQNFVSLLSSYQPNIVT